MTLKPDSKEPVGLMGASHLDLTPQGVEVKVKCCNFAELPPRAFSKLRRRPNPGLTFGTFGKHTDKCPWLDVLRKGEVFDQVPGERQVHNTLWG